MVELEEVEDHELEAPQPGPLEDDEDSADFTDTGLSIHVLFRPKPPIHFISPFPPLVSTPCFRPIANSRSQTHHSLPRPFLTPTSPPKPSRSASSPSAKWCRLAHAGVSTTPPRSLPVRSRAVRSGGSRGCGCSLRAR